MSWWLFNECRETWYSVLLWPVIIWRTHTQFFWFNHVLWPKKTSNHHFRVKHEFSIPTLVDAGTKTPINTRLLIIILQHLQYIHIRIPMWIFIPVISTDNPFIFWKTTYLSEKIAIAPISEASSRAAWWPASWRARRSEAEAVGGAEAVAAVAASQGAQGARRWGRMVGVGALVRWFGDAWKMVFFYPNGHLKSSQYRDHNSHYSYNQ